MFGSRASRAFAMLHWPVHARKWLYSIRLPVWCHSVCLSRLWGTGRETRDDHRHEKGRPFKLNDVGPGVQTGEERQKIRVGGIRDGLVRKQGIDDASSNFGRS